MGNAPTRARAFAVNPDAPLSDRDAWAIATAWHKLIANFLWLSGDRADLEAALPTSSVRRRPVRTTHTSSFSIVEDIEYVDFSFSGLHVDDLEPTALAARAATITWLALSCCPGYSGSDNPAFWWRVFSALDNASTTYVPPDEDDWSHLHIVDTHRFFPHPDRPFPCVRVRGLVHYTLPLFFHGETAQGRPQYQGIHDTLASALRAIAPFIRDTRWERALPVTVCTADVDVATTPLRSPASAANTNSPVFQLAEVTCVRDEHVNLTKVKALAANAKLSIAVSFGAQSVAASVLEGSSPCARIEMADLVGFPHSQAERETVAHFSTCCSALPHTRAVRTLRVVQRPVEPVMTETTAAWLGYAVFHPDADGSFTDLVWSISRSDRSAVESFAAMASGNNLLKVMGLSTTESTAYSHARLGVGASVRSAPPSSAEDGAILFAFKSEAWITVFPAEAPDAAWVRVVLPGHGLGWIARGDILEVVDRPPGASCVRRLHLATRILSLDDDLDVVLTLLSVLGERLESLCFMPSTTGGISAATVSRILEMCPNLKSLHVEHDGSAFSSANAAFLPTRPHLEELHLESNSPLPPLVAPQLGNLKRFQYTTAASNSVQENSASFLALLGHCVELQRVVWSGNQARIPFINRQRVRQILDSVITRGVHDVARVSLTTSSRLAFLSVVHAADPATTALGRFQPEIVRVVFSYSSSVVPRTFCSTSIEDAA